MDNIIGKVWEDVTRSDLMEAGFYEYTELRVLGEDDAFTMENQLGRLNVFIDNERRVTKIGYDNDIFN